MAKVNLNTIKNWFKTGLKPTELQFFSTWDSFWHKDEQIPVTSIKDFDTYLTEKANAETLQNHINNPTAHNDLFLKKLDKIENPIAGKKYVLNENNVFVELVEQEYQFTDDEEDRLRDLIYKIATQSISASPSSFEKGNETNVTFTWNVIKNDDTITSVTLDSNNVTSQADGTSKQLVVSNLTESKSVTLATVVNRNGSSETLNNTKTVPGFSPQYIGKMTTVEPVTSYTGLASHTKKVQSSSSLSGNISLNNEFLFFLSTSATKTPKDNLTGFDLSIGDWNNSTAFIIKKAITITLADGTTENMTLYRTREKKTQTLNISLV